MIINSSVVGMNSTRVYSSTTQAETASKVTTAAEAEKLIGQLSEDSDKNAIDQLNDADKNLNAQKKENEKARMANAIHELVCSNGVENSANSFRVSSKEDFEMQIVQMMLKALNGSSRRGSRSPLGGFSSLVGLSGMKAAYGGSRSVSYSGNISLLAGSENISSGSGTGVTVWKKTTAASVFFEETEVTQYSASGVAVTADGREINFGVDIEMSRAFSAYYNSFTQEDYICTDPLVINVDDNFTGVTDKKFAFDLDGDGSEEMISFASEGSGFLALDKNGDGKINDGGELFGTKSGDGFKDLAQYDQDGNGWIDEADDVFDKLKIWSKDENGNDRLISLKEAGVGAIYLGSADTEFALKDGTTNETNAVIRKTGVYLKESGEVGTIQHVDLAT